MMEQDDIFFCIPSFKRADEQTTVSFLNSAGYGKANIIVSVQNEQDFENYSKSSYAKDITLIRCNGENVSDNRNNLIKYCKSNKIVSFMFLDDDVSAIKMVERLNVGDKNKSDTKILASKEEINGCLKWCFNVARKQGAPVFGFYPIDNPFMQSIKIEKRNILIGAAMGILDNTLLFDRAFPVKEDYELCLRLINKKMPVLRFNNLSVVAKHKTKGGCKEMWDGGKSAEASEMLIKMYQGLVTHHPLRKGEVKYIGL